MRYTSPFTLTNKTLSLVAAISEQLGRFQVEVDNGRIK